MTDSEYEKDSGELKGYGGYENVPAFSYEEYRLKCLAADFECLTLGQGLDAFLRSGK